MNWHRTLTVARTDLRQLVQARDFWLPMGILGALFFVVVPTILLLSITSLGEVGGVQRLADTLEVLPQAAQDRIRGDTPTARTTYALSVYLFAPVAVVVPLTISTAVGAAAIVGEREGWKLDGARARVEKHMQLEPRRRVGRVVVGLELPDTLPEAARQRLEEVARGCPVAASIHPDTQVDLTLRWVDIAAASV